VEKDGYLMRVSRKEGSQLVWEDQVWRIRKPTPEPIRAAIDGPVLESLKQISPGRLDLEADFRCHQQASARLAKDHSRFTH